MPKGFNARTVRQGIKTFFAPPKRNITCERYPEKYYRHVWLDKKHYEAMVFLAKVNHITRKQMTHELMERAISDYLSDKILGNNKRVAAERAQGQQRRPSYFIVQFRHWLKAKGKNVDKLF